MTISSVSRSNHIPSPPISSSTFTRKSNTQTMNFMTSMTWSLSSLITILVDSISLNIFLNMGNLSYQAENPYPIHLPLHITWDIRILKTYGIKSMILVNKSSMKFSSKLNLKEKLVWKSTSYTIISGSYSMQSKISNNLFFRPFRISSVTLH